MLLHLNNTAPATLKMTPSGITGNLPGTIGVDVVDKDNKTSHAFVLGAVRVGWAGDREISHEREPRVRKLRRSTGRYSGSLRGGSRGQKLQLKAVTLRVLPFPEHVVLLS